jgi:hypothetical protein
MRLAAAGVAVALAAVLVVDLGGLAGDNQAGTTAPEAASDRGTGYGAPTDSAAAPNAEGAQTPAADVQPPAQTGGGGGIDALAAAEIGLGLTLALLLLGGVAFTFTARKT